MSIWDVDLGAGTQGKRNPLDPRSTTNPYGGIFGTPSMSRPQVQPRIPPLDPNNPLGIGNRGTTPPFAPSNPNDPLGLQNKIRPNLGGQNIVGMINRTERTPWYGGPNTAIGDMPPGASQSIIDQYYQKVMDQMPSRRQQGFADAGSVLGAIGSNEQTNRVLRGNFQQNYDQMMFDRENNKNLLGFNAQSDYDKLRLLAAADKRTSNNNAMQNIQLGGWLQQGGNADRPGGAHRAVSDQERAAATGLIDQSHAQLNAAPLEPTLFKPTWDYTPADPSTYTKPGTMENIGRYGDLAGGGISTIMDIFNRGAGGGGGGNPLSTFLSRDNPVGGLINKGLSRIPGIGQFFGSSPATTMIPGTGIPTVTGAGSTGMFAPGSRLAGLLGKAGPIAGAAAGTYGLLKDRGLKNNIMNGVMAGAGYGSFLPGIGTLAGMGIGAGIGALRGIGGPSQEELQGREAAGEGRGFLNSSATPAQQAEARQAGWAKPEQALTHIVLRDQFGEEAAGRFGQQLWQAEKKGPQAVQQLLTEIQRMGTKGNAN